MSKQPSVRASAIRDAIEYLERFQPGSQSAVLSRVPDVSRKAIVESARTEFVPVEHDSRVLDAIVEVLGRERAVSFWAAMVEELVDKPLLRPFVSGMLRIVDVTAARLVSIIVTGWPLVYRDMCEPREQTSPEGHPMLLYQAIAPEVRRHPNYLLPWRGLCVGCARVAKVAVQIRFRSAPDSSWAEAEFISEIPRSSAASVT